MLSNHSNRTLRGKLFAGGLALFAMGTLFGALGGMSLHEEQTPDVTAIEETPRAEEPAAYVEAPREIFATDDTFVEWTARFTQCGHEVPLNERQSLSGLNREAAALRFPEYQIDLFTTARVRMIKEFSCLCPAHYELKLEEGGVGVFRTDPNTFLAERLMVLPVERATVSKEAAEALLEGLVFDSLAGINEYFEGTEEPMS